MPQVIRWARKDTEELIRLWRKKKLLWDVKTEEYSDRKKRQEAINYIHQKIKIIIPRATVNDIKTKIHTLRSQYRRELRTLSQSLRSGDSDDVKSPRLWCYDLLEFLRPQTENSRYDNFPPMQELSEADSDDMDMREIKTDIYSIDDPLTPPVKKRKTSESFCAEEYQENVLNVKSFFSIDDPLTPSVEKRKTSESFCAEEDHGKIQNAKSTNGFFDLIAKQQADAITILATAAKQQADASLAQARVLERFVTAFEIFSSNIHQLCEAVSGQNQITNRLANALQNFAPLDDFTEQ